MSIFVISMYNIICFIYFTLYGSTCRKCFYVSLASYYELRHHEFLFVDSHFYNFYRLHVIVGTSLPSLILGGQLKYVCACQLTLDITSCLSPKCKKRTIIGFGPFELVGSLCAIATGMAFSFL